MDDISHVHPEIPSRERLAGPKLLLSAYLRYFVEVAIWEEMLAQMVVSDNPSLTGESSVTLERYWRMISLNVIGSVDGTVEFETL